MTKILSPLKTEIILGSDGKYHKLLEPYIFESDILKELGLKYICEIPVGFIYDLESVPFIRGTCPEAGTVHDYLCRIDSDPQVSKKIAASVYFEILHYIYSLDDTKDTRGFFEKVGDKLKKYIKWGAVYISSGYFHKLKVMSKYDEIIIVNKRV